MRGNEVDFDMRADAMAEYLTKVRWGNEGKINPEDQNTANAQQQNPNQNQNTTTKVSKKSSTVFGWVSFLFLIRFL